MLSIRNPETERLARLLAARRGVSMTEAITEALRKAVMPDMPDKKNTQSERWRKIQAVQHELKAMERPDAPSVEAILDDMYDEFGMPK